MKKLKALIFLLSSKHWVLTVAQEPPTWSWNREDGYSINIKNGMSLSSNNGEQVKPKK